jgi:peptidyl-prolyl cis-trans isomerase SurA
MPMKFAGALAIVLMSASMAHAQTEAAPAPRAPVRGEGVAAIVNDEVISTYDVKQRAALIVAGAGLELTEEVMERARAQALRDLVDERLQIQEARSREIVVDEGDVDRALADVAQQNGSNVSVLSQQLASVGAGLSTLRTQLEADIAWRRLVNGRFGSRVRISAEQIRATQARVTANAQRPQFLVSEILIPADSDAEMVQAEEIAGRLLQEIRNGAPFPSVARQFSASATAAAGGDLGWLAEGELRGDLQQVVEQLQPGQASRPVRGPGGVYILALRERREGVDPATMTRVAMRQISAPAEQRAALERQLQRVQNCDGLQRTLGQVEGAVITDLGDVLEAELSDDMRQRIAGVEAGGMTSISQTGDAVAGFMVCSRQTSGEGLPSAEQVEDRLFEQELAMLAQRYLRNLRRDSTIITR